MSEILKVNGLILLGYGLFTLIIPDLSGAIIAAIAIFFHVSILVFISIIHFIKKENEQGKWYLLSSFLVLLIGFGACVTTISMRGGMNVH